MKRPIILLADDDADILESYKFLLSDDYEVKTASTIQDAKKVILFEKIDVAVIDLNFEGQSEDGITLIDYAQKEKPDVGIIILSSDRNTKRVVEAMRRSLVDFVTKDDESEAKLRLAIKQSLAAKEDSLKSRFEFKTESLKMRKLLSQVDQALSSNRPSSIMILGESGTGKEHLAKYIASKLRKNIVVANMAAIQKETAESELFGHKKGAFTGAIQDKIGLIEKAHEGIFFLDEIGDCSLDLQAKLLRAIQEKEIMPMGSGTIKKINVHFIAATHRDLNAMVDEKTFRNDLLQRLNVFTFRIPSLRERPEDIEFYSRLYINEFAPHECFNIDPKGLEVLKRYSWRGNVRELRNVIERAVAFSKRRCLDEETATLSLYGEIKNEMCEVEKRPPTRNEIIEAINLEKGNKTKAAKRLGVHLSTIHRWVQDLSLDGIIVNPVGRPSMKMSQ